MRVQREGGVTAWLAGILVAKCSGTQTASVAGVTLSESFFPVSCSRRSEGLFGQSFSVALPADALKGLPCLCCSAHQACREAPLAGVLLCSSRRQSQKGAPWVGSYAIVQCLRRLMGQALCCSTAHAGLWRERGYGDGSAHCVTQQYRLASMAAWLSSTGISQHDLLPHIPLICLSAVNSSPWLGIAPQSKLQLPATVPSRESASLSGVCMAAAWTVWFSFHLGCHRSAVSLSDLNVSPLTQTIAPLWVSDPCFSSPTHQG